MKPFLVKIILFLALLFLLDKCFIPVRALSSNMGGDKKLALLLEGKLNKELIVVGSSRAREGIATWMLQDSLQLSAYNLAYGGSEIEFQEFLLNILLLHNKKPSTIIKIIDEDFELIPSEQNQFLRDRLYLFLKYPEVRAEMVKQKNKNPYFAQLFVLYLMNKENFKFWNLNQNSTEKTNDTLMQFGTLPESYKKKDRDWTYDTINQYNLSNELPNKVAAFENFQNLCIKHNIQLIYVIPPSYYTINPAFVNRLKKLLHSSFLLYIYDSSNPAYKDKNIFNDKVHLNKNGAKIFTKELIDFIKNKETNLK